MNAPTKADFELTDIAAISECKTRFLYCLDDVVNFGCDEEQTVAALLCEDAQLTMGAAPVIHGNRSIYTGLVSQLKAAGYTYISHMLSNPVIEVDGDIATGRWYVYCVIKHTEIPGEGYTWLHASYDDTFRKENGQWRLASVVAKEIHQPR